MIMLLMIMIMMSSPLLFSSVCDTCLRCLEACRANRRASVYRQRIHEFAISASAVRLHFLSVKGPSKDGPVKNHYPPHGSHRRNQASTGAKRRCEPWYQPCGGDGGPFLKRAFLLVK